MNHETGFPEVRLRRLRQHPAVREMLREVQLRTSNLLLPLFVRPGEGVRQPIASMPGQCQLTVDQLLVEAREAWQLGIPGVILFGIPTRKDALGTESWDAEGIIQTAVRELKRALPELLVVTDVCFCEYTDHGHCGVLTEQTGRVDVDNDSTLELLARQAVSHVAAGADIVAPSGMMDGMVGAIRRGLDAEGYTHIPILSYAAKYASGYYGPFREAAESAPRFGDRRAYQMDPQTGFGQAIREVQLDLAEGADIIMVKPALAYLDILASLKQRFPGVPLAAYNVSGEYSMVKAAAERGWIDARAVVLESLLAMRRAGADLILTYWAKDVAAWLR